MLEVVAEMVANVVTVEVAPGSHVAGGDILLVVESMKMEIPVLAPAAATVLAIQVDVADVVQEGDVLVLLEQD